MSLINDALKRAGQAKTPPPHDTTEAPLHAVESKPPSRFPLLILSVLFFVLGLAGWFFVRGWQAERGANLGLNKNAIEARELSEVDLYAVPKQTFINVPTLKNNVVSNASAARASQLTSGIPA